MSLSTFLICLLVVALILACVFISAYREALKRANECIQTLGQELVSQRELVRNFRQQLISTATVLGRSHSSKPNRSSQPRSDSSSDLNNPSNPLSPLNHGYDGWQDYSPTPSPCRRDNDYSSGSSSSSSDSSSSSSDSSSSSYSSSDSSSSSCD